MFKRATPKAFMKAIKQLPWYYGSFITHYTLSELKHSRLYLTRDKRTGFGILNGELTNLFNIGKRGRGKLAVLYAIRYGAYKLNCFDGYLTKYYGKLGFKVVNRIKWDDRYAPERWDYVLYGKPNVVEMELQV
jgi:hypothetical protein